MKLLIINGPNIQLLGRRDPGTYGSTTLPQLEARLHEVAQELGVECTCFQSNHEGAICDRIAEKSELAEQQLSSLRFPRLYSRTRHTNTEKPAEKR